MNHKEISNAINEGQTVKYENGEYKIIGYKVLKLSNQKEYFAGLLDLKNNRTILWVGINDI